MLQNALSFPSMANNLIPEFMMHKAGIIMNSVPKIQVTDPLVDDHAITFPETGFHILLSLWGTFSYFPMSKPSRNDLVDPQDIYLLTPTRWNPHSNAYARNEELMLDWEGNLTDKKD